MFFQDPRPYFEYEDLYHNECDDEFGKPSGHSFNGLVFYFIYFNSIYYNKFSNNLSRDSYDNLSFTEHETEDIASITSTSNVTHNG